MIVPAAGARRASQAGLATLLATLAACGPADRPSAPMAQRAAIYNGQPYAGHPMVGELRITGGICTATLIGKRTVLTAAHCFAKYVKYSFVVGGASYTPVSIHPHPAYDPDTQDNDIGLVLLDQAPPVAPAVLAARPPWVGQKVTLIGFGLTTEAAQDDGVKRIATATINKVSPDRIGWNASGGGTCYGDSGGPAFAVVDGHELQVGVSSTGELPCGNIDYHIRVDPLLAWIEHTAGGDVNKGEPAPDVETHAEDPATGQAAENGAIHSALGADGCSVSPLSTRSHPLLFLAVWLLATRTPRRRRR